MFYVCLSCLPILVFQSSDLLPPSAPASPIPSSIESSPTKPLIQIDLDGDTDVSSTAASSSTTPTTSPDSKCVKLTEDHGYDNINIAELDHNIDNIDTQILSSVPSMEKTTYPPIPNLTVAQSPGTSKKRALPEAFSHDVLSQPPQKKVKNLPKKKPLRVPLSIKILSISGVALAAVGTVMLHTVYGGIGVASSTLPFVGGPFVPT